MVVELSVTREGCFDFALEEALLLRKREPPMAFDGIGIGLFARHAHQVRDDFRCLPHVEVRHRVGQPALKSNDRIEVGRTDFQKRREFRERGLGRGEFREPAHAGLRKHQRRVAQRFRTTGEDQIGLARLDITISRVERLHAGAAIDLHRERHHAFTHPET